MSAARDLLALAERAGVRLYRQGDRVRWEAPTDPPADLLERLRAHKAELARIVPTVPGDWRADLESWPPDRRTRWCAKAAVLEVLDHLPAEEADRRAYNVLAGEPDAPEWIIAGGRGAMRLIVREAPPWPREVFEAAGIVEVNDHHHRHGEDALAARAAERLEEKLAELRRIGVEAWVAS